MRAKANLPPSERRTEDTTHHLVSAKITAAGDFWYNAPNNGSSIIEGHAAQLTRTLYELIGENAQVVSIRVFRHHRASCLVHRSVAKSFHTEKVEE